VVAGAADSLDASSRRVTGDSSCRDAARVRRLRLDGRGISRIRRPRSASTPGPFAGTAVNRQGLSSTALFPPEEGTEISRAAPAWPITGRDWRREIRHLRQTPPRVQPDSGEFFFFSRRAGGVRDSRPAFTNLLGRSTTIRGRHGAINRISRSRTAKPPISRSMAGLTPTRTHGPPAV